MKYLISLLLCFCCLITKAQLTLPLGSTAGNAQVGSHFTKQLVIPVYSDTTTATSSLLVDLMGTQIQIKNTGAFYIRDTSIGTHKWTRIFSNGNTPTWNNVMAQSPDLLQSYFSNLHSNGLEFDSAGFFNVFNIGYGNNISIQNTIPSADTIAGVFVGSNDAGIFSQDVHNNRSATIFVEPRGFASIEAIDGNRSKTGMINVYADSISIRADNNNVRIPTNYQIPTNFRVLVQDTLTGLLAHVLPSDIVNNVGSFVTTNTIQTIQGSAQKTISGSLSLGATGAGWYFNPSMIPIVDNMRADAVEIGGTFTTGGHTGVGGRSLHVAGLLPMLVEPESYFSNTIHSNNFQMNYPIPDTNRVPHIAFNFFDSTGVGVPLLKMFSLSHNVNINDSVDHNLGKLYVNGKIYSNDTIRAAISFQGGFFNGTYATVTTNPVDTSVLKQNTTINFPGEIPANNQNNYLQNLNYILGKPVINEGISGQTSSLIVNRLIGSSYLADTTNSFVIEMGYNDMLANLTTATYIIKLNALRAQAAITATGNNKYAFISVYNGGGSGTGTPLHDSIIAIDNWFRATFPGHYVDARAYAVSLANGAVPQDVYSAANDIPAWTTRTPDSLHPNKLGMYYLAKAVNDSTTALNGGNQIVGFGDSFTQGLAQYFASGYTTTAVPPFLTSTQQKNYLLANTYKSGDLTVFENIGRQDFTNGSTDTATILANIAAMVASLHSDKYLIYSTFNGDTTSEYSGQPTYNLIIAFNNRLAAIYGTHYYDLRAYIVSLYNPALPADVIAHTNDCPPPSLLNSVYQLNTTGYNYVQGNLATKIPLLRGTSNLLVGVQNNSDMFSASTSIGTQTPNIGLFSKISVGNTLLTNSAFALDIEDKTPALGINNTPVLYTPYVLTNAAVLTGTVVTGTARAMVHVSGNDGYFNTINGVSAAVALSKASQNTIMGYFSFANDTTGVENTFIGDHSGASGFNMSNNTGIGYSALFANTANSNTALGWFAMKNNTSGGGTATGASALFNQTTGTGNTGDGANTLLNNSTGNQNTALGEGAQQGVSGVSTTGNTSGGFHSLFANTGTGNTGLGNTIMDSVTNNFNTAIGYRLFRNLRNGTNNLGLGANISAVKYNGSGYTTIQNSLYGFNGGIVPGDSTINVNGRWTIGDTTFPASALFTLTSTNKGFLMPRMTSANFNSISSKAAGLEAYDNIRNAFVYYDGSAIRRLYDSAAFTAGIDMIVTPALSTLTISADTTTGATKLATQGFVTRNSFWTKTGNFLYPNNTTDSVVIGGVTASRGFTNLKKSYLADTVFIGGTNKVMIDSGKLRIVGDIESYQSGVIKMATMNSYASGTYSNVVWNSSNGGRFEVTDAGTIRYAHTIFTPTTGQTITLTNNFYNIVNPAGALVALTVTLPASPVNNDVVYIKYTQAVTTVTYTGGTVIDGIVSPAAGGVVVLTYDGNTASWY